MNTAFKKLALEIDFKINKAFDHVQLVKAKLQADNVFLLQFESREIIPFDQMKVFVLALNNNFKYKAKFTFDILSVVYQEETIRDYLNWVVGSFLSHVKIAEAMSEAEMIIEKNNVILMIDSHYVTAKLRTLIKTIERIMSKFGFKYFTLEAKQGTDFSDLIGQSAIENSQDASRILSKKTSDNRTIVTKRSSNGYKMIKISDLETENERNVLTEGEIFSIRQTATKKGGYILTMQITDFSDAISLKVFLNTSEELAKYDLFAEGDYVSIKGQYQIDAYTNEPVISARSITKVAHILQVRQDNATKKRIELSARSHMSTMDGITSARDYVNRVASWGHKALAIVDTDSIQSFPDFSKAAKEANIKAIYGATFNVLEKNHHAIIRPLKRDLSSDTYIAFDLETTGLSATYDDIIEFGAIKIVAGQIVDSQQFFVKPNKKIPTFIKEMTGIDDKKAATGLELSVALDKIINYIGNFTLVAHNANFDISFLNAKLIDSNKDVIANPLIDTIVVARFLLPKNKRFRLKAVAQNFGVEYEGKVAHRADYDATVLAKVWVRMIDQLVAHNINLQADLFAIKSNDLYQKARPREVTILAKNQAGIKELFKLISQASTETFFKTPSLFLEDLASRKNLLMGSGALNSRLVDAMFYGTKRQVEDEIKLYDYIEVQPPQNFAHFLNRGWSKANIEDALKNVIDLARKANITVVATGDVRYLDQKDKIYHEVYISAKGLGGIRHYLFNYSDQSPVYPNQHLLTTKEMREAFVFLEDNRLIEEIVVKNSQKINDSIDPVTVLRDKLYTPKFTGASENLQKLVYENAHKIYGKNLPQIVSERIEKELTPLRKYGYDVIYWISHILVKKSLEDGYLVGSRGSIGSSLVATLANITEVNPLVPHYVCPNCQWSEFFPDSKLNSGYDLPDKSCPQCSNELAKEGQKIPFETFLGFDADKVPDIDLNFSSHYQATIHQEVKKMFGEEHSFRAGTISTVAERTAFGYVKAWQEERGQSLSKTFINYLTKGLVGTKRTTGQHPGGIIVIPSDFDVEDFTPINFPANDQGASWKTTHFDFHAIHDNVLKLDLLGHDDPTAIRELEKLTGVSAKTIPMSDPKVIGIFSSTEALGIVPEDINGEVTGAMGIPEFGTKFVRQMLRKANVKSFGDLISLSGLSHGTDVWTNNAEVLIKTEGITLNDIISCRDDIMVDLMAKGINSLEAFTIMEQVRKGKSITAAQNKLLVDHGVAEWYINSLKNIKYMFPKAHATAYVMMAWRVAWFKVYYPIQYYATFLTTRADVLDITTIIHGKSAVEIRLKELIRRRYLKGALGLTNKEQNLITILEIVNEAYARSVKFLNIDLLKSDSHNWVIEDGGLIPPLVALDGLGDSVARSIIEARKVKKFTSLKDLKERTQLNKTSLSKLEALGALKNFALSDQTSLF